MKKKYTCDLCETPTDKLYEVQDEGSCEKCFLRAAYEAERAYESQREDYEL